MDELELAEAVAAGAEFMDLIDANVTDDAERWFWVVRPETLDMRTVSSRNGAGCVLAQHHPDGWLCVDDYALAESNLDEWYSMGFDIRGRHGDDPAAFSALTALWREEIIERRAAWFDAHPEAVIA